MTDQLFSLQEEWEAVSAASVLVNFLNIKKTMGW